MDGWEGLGSSRPRHDTKVLFLFIIKYEYIIHVRESRFTITMVTSDRIEMSARQWRHGR